jgi:hypothetical protein
MTKLILNLIFKNILMLIFQIESLETKMPFGNFFFER